VLSALTGATKVILALCDDATRGWHLVPGDEDVAAMPIEVAAERGLLPLSAFRFAQRSSGNTIVEDATSDERFARDSYFAKLESCSLLLMPVQSQGLLRAILILENHLTRGAFSADRLDAAALIAGQLATSLDNAMLYRQLERKVLERTDALEQANRRLAALSVTDELTGLANRRYFNEVLQAEWLRASRHRRPVALLMIDIDYFKQYNDCYGHLEGDACLQRVAEAMRTGARHGLDTVARYGGEEFAMVLPETTIEGAEEAAARVQASIRALARPHFASLFGLITASIGVAAMTPQAHTTADQLVAAADQALYAAKARGRNCVVATGPGLL
jgi:diguanylate cyclase (GGDEF)-like protein